MDGFLHITNYIYIYIYIYVCVSVTGIINVHLRFTLWVEWMYTEGLLCSVFSWFLADF